MLLEITTTEVKKIIEQASAGDWLPIGVIMACLTLVVVLFLYILKIKEASFNTKHTKTDEKIDKLTENTNMLNTMIAVHDADIKNLKQTA